LKDLRFRCTKCGSRLTDHVVMSRDALSVQPWRIFIHYLDPKALARWDRYLLWDEVMIFDGELHWLGRPERR
jgi:hypothetical protein